MCFPYRSDVYEPCQFILLVGVALSVVGLVVQTIRGTWKPCKPKGVLTDSASHGDNHTSSPLREGDKPCQQFVERSGGHAILTFKLVQLLSCVALLCLSIASGVLGDHGLDSGSTLQRWARLVQWETYAYTSVLALAVVLVPHRSSVLSGHLSCVLILTWVVYVYRDIVPLATTTINPADADEGVLLWVKMAILTEAAVFIPLFMPRGKGDASVHAGLNKEQAAGWLSQRIFSWLDGIVFQAHRVDHIPLDEFPPLADADSTRTLIKGSLKFLDPLQTKKNTHIIWGFLRTYRSDILLSTLVVTISSVFSLSWPVATQGLLFYLEEGHPQSTVRPWAWVLLLFVGPTLSTVCGEWYQWIMSRLSIHNEAILTELLFQHALRIRVKSETSSDDEGASTAVGDVNESGVAKAAENAKPRSNNFAGRLNNLIASDLKSITDANGVWLILLVQAPVKLVVSIVFMYNVLGLSAFVALGTLVVLIPIPGYISGWIQLFQKKMIGKTDARVQLIHEVLNVVRMIKLFGWEQRMATRIEERREAEIVFQGKFRWLEIINSFTNYSIPLVTMAITFGFYTAVMKQELTASKLFSSNAAFILIQSQMHYMFFAIPVLTQARISLDRVNDFMLDTELLDEFTLPEEDEAPTIEAISIPHEHALLGIKNTSFTWANDDATVETPASTSSGRRPGRRFVLNIDGELLFKRGQMNLIIGPTGSGKTSLLMALLGEMHARPGGPDSFVSIPRDGGVAYAAQESWVLSDTIRNNILFNAPYDEPRYVKVIKQCALERDLSLFDAGDQTEVGEKGITLSGGQKARVTLARTVYSSAEILILDDVLAALDVHTGRWIVDHCFKGELLRGRTIILVSHNVALTRPIADFVVVLGTDGRIASQGSFDKTLQDGVELLNELVLEEEQLKVASEVIDKPKLEAEDAQKNGKLIVAEEIKEGEVGWDTLRLFVMNTSKTPRLYWVAYIFLMIVTHTFFNGQSWYLGVWAAQYETHAPSEVSVSYYLSIYAALVILTMAIYACAWAFYLFGSMRASRIIHRKLVDSILGTTLRWLDKTPTSRVIARCTADMQAVDRTLARYVLAVMESAVFMSLKVIAVAFVAPIFILPAVIVGTAGGVLGKIFTKAQICVKREMSNTHAPVLGHFSSAISGLVSIRAYGAQEQFKAESYLRVDRYSRAALIYHGLTRWVTVRADAMGSLLSAILAINLIYGVRISASSAGFAMTMAVAFSSTILFWVRQVNILQISGMCLERIQQYLDIEQEPKPTIDGVPPAYWPASGDLRVEHLSASYSSEGSRVLHKISFEVKSGERIGIVGRTGSGKSSLTLALLRCILTEGEVYYDGLLTDKINLNVLRSNITIIPQMPELLSGTLRRNLDPFGQHDDATLNDALRSAGLFSLQESEDSGRLTLDSEIAGGGGNLSVGQRQILALARAIVRRSKLLILDEVMYTDYATDAIIQNSLREELGRDVTVLTIAHRLQSIMDADRIMVLDAGRIVEYDTPRKLLDKTDGYFRSLVDGSHDKAALLSQAGFGQASQYLS
ncbi:multidrug resistance-associated ABC transporter [Trametes gibbosa]|nr:multidrug resistance-associated ABC transporter [Trametes gibbosa]